MIRDLLARRLGDAQARRTPVTAIASLDRLEARVLMTGAPSGLYTWNALGGDFNTASNWTGPGGVHAVPSSGDDAVIPDGDYTITVTQPDTVSTIASGAILSIASGGSLDVLNASSGRLSTLANLDIASGGSLSFEAGSTEVTPAGYSQNSTIAGTLNLASGATLILGGSVNGAGSGLALEAGVNLTGGGSYEINSDVEIDGAVTSPENLTLNAPNGPGITGSGTLTVPLGAYFIWEAGSMSGAGSTVISQGATLELEASGAKSLEGWTLSNAGSATWSGTGNLTIDGLGQLINTGGFEVTSSETLNGSAYFINDGTLSVDSAATLTSGLLSNDGAIDGPGTLDIAGSGVLLIPGSTTSNLSGVTINNASEIDWSGSGSLNLTNGASINNLAGSVFYISGNGVATSDGSASGNNEGTLVIDPSTPGVANLSALNFLQATTGVIDLDSGTLSLGALDNLGSITIQPGAALQVASFAQATNATLTIQIAAGPSFGQIQVAGLANFGGTMNVDLTGGYTPTVGQTSTLFTFEATAGNFRQINTSDLPVDLDFEFITYPDHYDLYVYQAPVQPPSSLALVSADDTGGSGVTAVHNPRLTGSATPGQQVQIYDQNARLVAVATASSNGVFVSTPLVAFAPGTYELTAFAINGLGTYSLGSAPFSLTITPPPPAPTALTLLPADDTSGPGMTTIVVPRFSGQTQPNLLVQVYALTAGAPILVATATADAGGNFLAHAIAPLSSGTYSLVAVAIDAGGNYSGNSSPLALTILPSVPPPSPTGLTLLAADDTGGPGVTAVHNPRLTGFATPGDLVQVYDDGLLVATATAGSNGVFVTTPSVGLSSGTDILTAYAISPSDVYSPASAAFSLTISSGPAAPTGLGLLPAEQSGGSHSTNSTQPQFVGTAVAGLLIQIYDQSNRLVATGVVGSNGGFVASSIVTLSPGQYQLSAYAIDAYGNYSGPSVPFTLQVV